MVTYWNSYFNISIISIFPWFIEIGHAATSGIILGHPGSFWDRGSSPYTVPISLNLTFIWPSFRSRIRGKKCSKCCSRQGPEAICDISTMLQKGTKRVLMGAKNDYGRVPKTAKTRHPKRSKMWFPSRTGGTLSPKSDLRDVYNVVPKRSQKGLEKVPQKCSKRYVYWGFGDFTTFQKGSKKVSKNT